MFQKKGSQGIRLGVGDDLETATAESLGKLLLHSHCNEDLASGPSPPLPRPDASNYGFVHFNVAGKSIVCSVSNGTTEAMKHRPGGLVGTKTQKAMKRFGRHSILRSGHMPSRSEPNGEGRLCVVEDSARCSGNPTLACFAPPTSITRASPCHMNSAGMKILMANVTNPDNRDKRHRQETNQGTLRSSLDSPYSPVVEESDRHLPFQHTSIAAFVWIPR
jgi:hypothetical protein